MVDERLRSWRPLSPRQVAVLLEQAEFPWWIAGGHAIDHFVGRSLRLHADIDVLLLRKDQAPARKSLAGWDCRAAGPSGTLRLWEVGEDLPISVHDVWCRQDRDGSWQVQLMLDDGDRCHWRSRRCSLVTRPIAELGKRDENGIPFLAAEIQLFYKAKAPRERDQADFSAALPLLNSLQRRWLREAIETAYGAENPWLKEINRGR